VRTRKVATFVGCPVVFFLLFSCGATGGSRRSGATSAAIGSESSSVPAGCSEDAVRAITTKFLSAYNANAGNVVERFIAPFGEFLQFEARDRVGVAAKDLKTLQTYLTTRRAQGEIFSLKTIRHTGFSGTKNASGFVVEISNTSTAGRVTIPVVGTVGCNSGLIASWKMAG
jgi:hypothetical protein